MSAVMSILMAHEMGHFLQAVRYKVPASLPFFIPMPLPPIGTMGAVIAMPSSRADRRQLFDIGISGPLAGLVLAIPIAWFGIQTARVETIPVDQPAGSGLVLQDPLLFKAFTSLLHPELKPGQDLILNPLLLAGWVGMLITGLNMLPISQLDGGHVAYALFGRFTAHLLAWAMVAAAIIFIVATGQYGWVLMLALVVYIGPAHPPTSNDRVPLGWGRRLLGLASLLIPVLCFVPTPIRNASDLPDDSSRAAQEKGVHSPGATSERFALILQARNGRMLSRALRVRTAFTFDAMRYEPINHNPIAGAGATTGGGGGGGAQ